MEQLVLHVHHRLIGLELGDIAVDGCITTALRGAELAWPIPVDQGTQGIKRSCGCAQGTHDIIRDAKWSQPCGVSGTWRGGAVNRVAGRGQIRRLSPGSLRLE